MNDLEKVIIVEGRSDKQKVEEVISEDATIICTNGTISLEKIDQLIEEYELDDRDVFLLVDSDSAGEKLRKLFRREIPHIIHLYVDRAYREVEDSPSQHIAKVLLSANIAVNPNYLK